MQRVKFVMKGGRDQERPGGGPRRDDVVQVIAQLN